MFYSFLFLRSDVNLDHGKSTFISFMYVLIEPDTVVRQATIIYTYLISLM